MSTALRRLTLRELRRLWPRCDSCGRRRHKRVVNGLKRRNARRVRASRVKGVVGYFLGMPVVEIPQTLILNSTCARCRRLRL